MARNNQWANEWMVFSPNFKQMINQAAGRNVDLGDYSMARQTLPEAKNSSTEMQMLLNSSLEGVQYLGPDRARVTIVGGGRRVSAPCIVRMTRWELKIRGQDTPASGTVSRPGDAIQVNADGSITVRVTAEPGVAAALRTVPRGSDRGLRHPVRVVRRRLRRAGGRTSEPPRPQPQAQPGAFPPAGAGGPPRPQPPVVSAPARPDG